MLLSGNPQTSNTNDRPVPSAMSFLRCSEKLAFQIVLSLAPIGHRLGEQSLPIRAVVWVQRVGKFMGNDIVDEMRRRLCQLTIQHQTSLRGKTSPALRHRPNY